MKTLPKSLVVFVLLSSCGKPRGGDGFISDANVCRPLELPDENPLDSSTGEYAIPGATSAAIRMAQLTEAETSQRSAWGAELFLGSLTAAEAKLKISVLVKRGSGDLEIPTVGPDGTQAFQPFFESVDSLSAKMEPGWVRVQFPGVITLNANDALWIIADSNFTSEDQIISWWLQTGTGLYVTAAASPVFASVSGFKAAHRIVYCE